MNSVPIRRIQKSLKLFQTLDEQLPMGLMITLLALADGKEHEMRSLIPITGLTPQALHRALLYLGERHSSRKSKKHGLLLIDRWTNPSDERQKVVKLSRKGREFIRDLKILAS